MPKRSSLSGLIPSTNYHSAHKPPVDALFGIDRWTDGRVVAFTHDILTAPDALTDDYGPCDVLVSDLPWQRGFDVFNQRADISDGRTYDQFMRRVAEIVEQATVPTYLITGRHALRHLPEPATVLPMYLNEDAAVAIGYRPGPEDEDRYGTAPEFLVELTRHYRTAGDFCCGYGRTARVFLRANRHAVVSDVNPQCIGYIAETAPQWVAS